MGVEKWLGVVNEEIQSILIDSDGWAGCLPHCFLGILFRKLVGVGHFGHRSLDRRNVIVLMWNNKVLCTSYTDTHQGKSICIHLFKRLQFFKDKLCFL